MENNFKAIIIVLGTLIAMQANASPALPGGKCQVAPHKFWSEAEAWVWGEICEGRVADFNERYYKTLDPNVPSEWGHHANNRRLGQRFLETILLYDPWRSAIPRQGVRVTGAFFPDQIDFMNARIGHDLKLYKSRFQESIMLAGGTFEGFISLESSKFEGPVNLSGIKTVNSVVMSSSIFSAPVHLISGEIGGQLDLSSSIFSSLAMNWLQVKLNLRMSHSSFQQGIFLLDSRINGQIDLSYSTFSSAIVMRRVVSGGGLDMRHSIFQSMIWLNNSNLVGDLELQNAEFGESTIFDLTGTKIAGELRMGTKEASHVRWGNGSSIILRNAQVFTIQDSVSQEGDDWPDNVMLDGFIYDRLGGPHGEDGHSDMISRDLSWYISWLARNPSISTQSYEHLAEIFHNAGYPTKANTILYAGREHERIYATGFSRLGLEILKWSIGYGLGTRYFRALWWVAGFVFLGMMVLRISGEGPRNKMPYGFAFSVDHLLPIVTLRKYHFDVTLNGWPRYYFYFHKLLGYVLASFLIAGMAGLTQ